MYNSSIPTEMAHFQEVNIYDVTNRKSFAVRSRFCKTVADLQLQVSNETGISKGRQLLLWQGECLCSMVQGCFKDVIPRNTVYLYDLESPMSNHQPNLETADVPTDTGNIDNHLRTSALFSHSLLRELKNTKETQKHLIDSEYEFRLFLRSEVKEMLPLLSDWQKTIEERLKTVNSVLSLMCLTPLPACRDLQKHFTNTQEVVTKLLSYEMNLKQISDELKQGNKFEGCQDNCCVKRFQHSVSQVEQSHRRISSISESDGEEVRDYTRNHESAHISRKCRAMSLHLNTHCQKRLLTLIQQIREAVRAHLNRRKIIEEVRTYLEELRIENTLLDDLLKQRMDDVKTCIMQIHNIGQASQEFRECTHLPTSRSESVEEQEELVSEITVYTRL